MTKQSKNRYMHIRAYFTFLATCFDYTLQSHASFDLVKVHYNARS